MGRTATSALLCLLPMALSATPCAAAQQSQPPAPTVASVDPRQGHYVEINGARIFYQVSGQGTPLLLIHGFPLSGELFVGQFNGLDSRFKVVTPDLRGFGKSSTPGPNASEALYARDMLALMDKLGITKAVIGGHSMGGQITLEMYRQAPQRFLGMILIDTNPAAASIVEQGEFPAFGAQAQAKGVPSIAPILAPQMLTGTYRLNNRSGTQIMLRMLSEGSVDGVKGGGEALATRRDYSGLLPKISVPALVVVGVDDPIYGFEISRKLKTDIPNSNLAIIPGAEHASIFEQRAFANQAIAQWAKASGLVSK